MKNFVIINGVNSNTINGLGINELPPISKPSMRVLTEEIDGRDGDITTNLGYSAYDKTITIGLFGTGYDINDIISFFNGEGTIVFSNEDDKYYKYKIINQIDYEALLKFKQATITFHCQPFKYPLTETPLEIEYDYIEDEGETLTLNNTGEATLELNLKGNTSQYSTTGKNMLNINDTVSSPAGNWEFSISGNTLSVTHKNTYSTGTPTINMGTLSSGTYVISGTFNRVSLNRNGSYSATLSPNETFVANGTETISISFTNNEATTLTYTNMQIELGSTPTSYEEYTGKNSSPSPSYPQPINVVSGDNTIKVEGKNLCVSASKVSNTVIGFTPSKKIAKTFTLSFKSNETLTSNTTYFRIDGTDTSSIGTTSTSDGIAKGTFTISDSIYEQIQNATTFEIRIYKSGASFDTPTEAQIENNNTNTPYEPYQSQTYPINLPILSNNLFNGKVEQGAISSITGQTYEQCKTENATRIRVVDLIELDITKNYTISVANGYSFVIQGFDNDKKLYNIGQGTWQTTAQTITNVPYIAIAFKNTAESNITPSEIDNIKCMLNIGSSPETYDKYETLELCKIGDYQDYFTKNSDGQWCKYNAIGKVVLDGSENWEDRPNYTDVDRFVLGNRDWNTTTKTLLSNYFVNVNTTTSHDYPNIASNGSQCMINFTLKGTTTLAQFKEWLSTHNTTIYYILATPYLSLIEDTTLINQLDNIQNAMSYEGQTNIGQVNDDKPFIISAKALEKGSNEVVVNNIGNAYSKPLIALEGNGNVDIYLNDNQILQANVEDKMNIDIDTLEAYNPDTSALLNRQVIGNYNSMTLPSGNSTIRIDGALDKATITNYTRWL